MATIDSNGVLFYQDSDNFNPPASLNLAQSNLSDLLSSGVRFKRVANTTARSALVTSIGLANITPANPLLVWRADATAGLQLEYTTNGSTWRTIADKGELTVGTGKPYAMAAGQGGITVTQGSNASLVVSFPVGRFSVPPRVTLSQNGSNPTLVNMIMGGVTASGFTVYASRNAAGSGLAYFDWQAIQMLPGSAGG